MVSPILAAPQIAAPAPAQAVQTSPRLSAALRRSDVGCANPELTALSGAEREACRRRLASGAAAAPFISGIEPKKAAYYAELAASEAAMDINPLGGHGPSVRCGPGPGIKLGPLPCHLVPPQSPFTPEVDVTAP